jgi:hypothetical protein
MKQLWGIRFSHILLVVVTLILSTTTFVLATIPLLLLRISAGASRFIILIGLTTIGFMAFHQAAIWIPFLIACSLVAIYQQARELDCGLAQSGLVSILGTSGLLAFCLGLYIHVTDLDLMTIVNEKTQLFVNAVKQIQPELTLETEKIAAQIPSAVIMVMMIALWLGLVGTKYFASRTKMQGFTGMSTLRIQQILETKLRDFQLPAFVIWIALPVIGATFIEFDLVEIKMIAGNLLNILLVLYFFHGLSIIAVFFRAYEVGIFWQAFWYIILTVHMFLLVSSLGFADFWMNFRSKIDKKPAKTA